MIDWRDFTYSNEGENVFPLLFTAPNSEDTLPLSARDSIMPALWKDRFDTPLDKIINEIDAKAHDTPRGYRTFSFDLSKLDYQETTLVMWSFTQLIPRLRSHFRGSFSWLASMSDEDVLRWLLHNALLLHPDIAAKVEKQWRRTVSNDNVIGVHVRHSDRKIPLEPYYKALDGVFKKVPNAELLVATDNIGVQKQMVQRYKKVVYNEKWFPEEGKIMHQSVDCPDRTQNAIDALLDMYMLAKCKYLIFAGSSTFSYLSSLISTYPRENIIDTESKNPIIQIKKTVKRLLV